MPTSTSAADSREPASDRRRCPAAVSIWGLSRKRTEAPASRPRASSMRALADKIVGARSRASVSAWSRVRTESWVTPRRGQQKRVAALTAALSKWFMELLACIAIDPEALVYSRVPSAVYDEKKTERELREEAFRNVEDLKRCRRRRKTGMLQRYALQELLCQQSDPRDCCYRSMVSTAGIAHAKRNAL